MKNSKFRTICWFLRVAPEDAARCAEKGERAGMVSVSCASRRAMWRVAPVTKGSTLE
ncbi:hypothetical protein A2U01_0069895, partial [Trifolium medium]|nr:hypothetical protein [Trifolium medium]